MKKIITFLIAFLLSCTTISEAQTQTYYKYRKQNQTEVYIPWKLTNDGCYGCASFYWLVDRTFLPANNTYKFEIWFYSNSFYVNGTWASTYVQGLYFNIDGYNLYNEQSWLLFKNKYTSSLTTFFTPNPTPVIKMTWASLKVY